MTRLFPLLLVVIALGFASDPSDPWWPGTVVLADDGDGGGDGDGGDGGDGNGGDGGDGDGDGGDGGDGDGDGGDGGDGDGDGGDGGDGDGDGGDGGDGDGEGGDGDGEGGDDDGADRDDGDDDGRDDGESSASAGSGGVDGAEGGRNFFSDLTDLVFGVDRPTVPNEVLVLTPAGQTPPDLSALQAAGFAVLEDVSLLGLQARVLRLSAPPGSDIDDAAETVRGLSPGSSVDLNDLYERAGSGCDNDCWAASLVALEETARTSCHRGAPIAMIDTGVSRNHPALRGARIRTRSFLRPGVAAAPMDHGTAIAALLVGRAVPGAHPLAPDAPLLAAEVMTVTQERQQADALALVEALDWAVASRARVVALSLAGHRNVTLQFAIQRASRRANLVAAAGNGGASGDPVFPAAYPEVTAVAAVDARLRPYRNGTRGAYIELTAPGVDVPSASASGGTATFTGTSFAVPFAVAAMLRARARTGGDPQAARRLLNATARDLGASGRDDIYGYGLIQAPGQRCF